MSLFASISSSALLSSSAFSAASFSSFSMSTSVPGPVPKSGSPGAIALTYTCSNVSASSTMRISSPERTPISMHSNGMRAPFFSCRYCFKSAIVISGVTRSNRQPAR